MKVFVAGSGGWGTASSVLLCSNGHQVTLWSFFSEEAETLSKERENKKFLKGVTLPNELHITSDISKASDADVLVIATPSFALRQTLNSLKPYLNVKAIVCLTKGFDRDNNFCLFSETIDEILENRYPIVALTGPSHAEEVGRLVPTAVVAASKNKEAAEFVQSLFMSDTFRVYTTPDIIGAELGGALKNIIALAVGICDGAGFGDNTKAALMTRGLTEMARLGVSLGGKSETFAGLSGVGDLIVTCVSMHSRNHRAGILIGQGKSPSDAIKEVGSVVEGYFATEAGHYLSKKTGIEMPICEALYRVLYCEYDVKLALNDLMTRDKKPEIEEVWMQHIHW
ncbi:MAG: NAD(P)-dependent glycerol-3-phosphate dehydrogenase [Clostridiales bacterium]|nr:NAD(P)-dependent glycerol-3-phosphate dehydrogenase [Clostridiales bacterium]